MRQRERELVAAAARRLGEAGFAPGTAGNVSLRAGDLVAVTAAGADLRQVSAEQVVVVDLDGAPRRGPGAPTSELALHLGVHRGGAAAAVVHAHPPISTAMACVLDELPPVHYQMVSLGGAVPVARYATTGTEELARRTLDALADRPAVMMANHGTLTVGADLDEAIERTELLEWAAALFWRASAIRAPRTLTDSELDDVRSRLSARRSGARQPAEVHA